MRQRRILKRVEIVREVGRTKASAAAPMLRPASEAQIIPPAGRPPNQGRCRWGWWCGVARLITAAARPQEAFWFARADRP